MAFIQLHWSSHILGRQTTTWVLVPDTGTGPFAAFYLLHGLTDDHTAWLRHTRINDYAAPLPLVVVMPDAGRSFYTNHVAGPKWATHLAEELPAFIERILPVKKTREGRCVGGLSMGGYGAMRLALGYPDRYISATSHSGALHGPNYKRTAISPDEFAQMIGPAYDESDHDLTALARRGSIGKSLPKLRIDCGTEDFLLEDNREFHESLKSMNIVHEYEEFPGAHEWGYWDLHIREALAFHSRALGINS